ncbi:MAG: TlyA family RNA methyltransferase [Sphaerochaetaceae bacterium]|nr:TlyA family RNA methyltransferase [Sphaerochaetaceae bacterium]
MAKVSVIKLLQNHDPSLDKDKATALVICKNVYVDGELCTDPRRSFPSSSSVDVVFPKYVSRGGFKLEKALDSFQLDSIEGKVALDAGSSTGGFSDCLLQRGVKAVHCVDVGFNLLDFKIRSDSRTVIHEKCNIMNLTLSDLDPKPDFAVADLSFRSLKGAARHVLDLTFSRWMIALIKPQFEVPRWQEDFFGVVNDPGLMKETLAAVWENLDEDGVGVYDAVVSPIKGHKGNTEFLALLKDKGDGALSSNEFIEKCLKESL